MAKPRATGAVGIGVPGARRTEAAYVKAAQAVRLRIPATTPKALAYRGIVESIAEEGMNSAGRRRHRPMFAQDAVQPKELKPSKLSAWMSADSDSCVGAGGRSSAGRSGIR